MDITYLGEATFKLRGKEVMVVCDPIDKKNAADIVTLSGDYVDKKLAGQIPGTSRRSKPYVISAPGEYEIQGVGVFGWKAGEQTLYSLIIDGVRVLHVGHLKNIPDDDVVEGLGTVDVLLLSVVDAKIAAAVVEKLSPSIVVPIAQDKTQESEFLKTMGVTELQPLEKLKATPENLPEETQVVTLIKS